MKAVTNRLLFFLLFVSIAYIEVRATGISGASITYQLLDTFSGKYKITLEFYAQCGTILSAGNEQLSIFGHPTLNKITVFHTKKEDISPIAWPPDVVSPVITRCNGVSNFEYIGYQKFTYEATVVIGKNMGFILFGWGTCCRNIGLTNIVGGSGAGLFVQAAVNTNYQNSSPIHSKPEMIQLYKYKQNQYNMRATDVYDPKSIQVGGKMVVLDSLVYELLPSFTAPSSNIVSMSNLQNPSVQYTSPLAYNQCFFASPPMTIQQDLNQVLVNPNRDQSGHLAYVVKEYRAIPNAAKTSYTRALVGYSMRDVYLDVFGTADPVMFSGILKDSSNIDTLINSYTAGSCGLDNKIMFKVVGAPFRKILMKDLTTLEPNYISNLKMSYFTRSGNNVDTVYVTFTYKKKRESPFLHFLFDAYYVNPNGRIVSSFIPITVVPGNGKIQLDQDSIYFCSTGTVRLDASIGFGAKWSPLTSVFNYYADSSIIDIAPSVSRWYKASNLSSPASCKLNDSVYVKVQTCDTVFGVVCLDRNKNCLCDPWEYKVKNAVFDVKGVTNAYTATVTTDTNGSYRITPPSLNSYHIEGNGMLFNCGINNKKTRAFNMTLFGNMKVDIPLFDSVVISNFTTQMLDTNFCFGDTVNYDLYFFKNYGQMRAIIHYGDGTQDTIKNYSIEAGYNAHSFIHKYSKGGQYIAKLVFTDLIYSPKDSVLFRPIMISNCAFGSVFIDSNANCSIDTLDKILSTHRLALKNNTTNQVNLIFTASDGKFKTFLNKNQSYTLSNAIPLLCNSGKSDKTIPAFSVDTSIRMDMPLDPKVVNYTLVAQKTGNIANNEKLQINLGYGGYFLADTALKRYELLLPPKTSIDAISPNATYVQNGALVQITQNSGQESNLVLTFSSLLPKESLCFSIRLMRVLPEIDTSDNFQYFCLNEGGEDLALNQKQVSIASQINQEDFLNKNDYLYYQINFINNRTISANHVYITDTLDSKLDIGTFQLIKQSHKGQIVFRSNNEVVFTYKDINLPDSATNNAESRGYVIFSVKPKSSLMANDIIRNQGNIVFDFIQNVWTNITASRYLTSPPVSIQSGVIQHTVFYPNPSKDYIYVRLHTQDANTYQFYLWNVIGQRILLEHSRSAINTKKEVTLDVQSVPKGIYFLQGLNSKGEIIPFGKVEVIR